MRSLSKFVIVAIGFWQVSGWGVSNGGWVLSKRNNTFTGMVSFGVATPFKAGPAKGDEKGRDRHSLSYATGLRLCPSLVVAPFHLVEGAEDDARWAAGIGFWDKKHTKFADDRGYEVPKEVQKNWVFFTANTGSREFRFPGLAMERYFSNLTGRYEKRGDDDRFPLKEGRDYVPIKKILVPRREGNEKRTSFANTNQDIALFYLSSPLEQNYQVKAATFDESKAHFIEGLGFGGNYVEKIKETSGTRVLPRANYYWEKEHSLGYELEGGNVTGTDSQNLDLESELLDQPYGRRFLFQFTRRYVRYSWRFPVEWFVNRFYRTRRGDDLYGIRNSIGMMLRRRGFIKKGNGWGRMSYGRWGGGYERSSSSVFPVLYAYLPDVSHYSPKRYAVSRHAVVTDGDSGAPLFTYNRRTQIVSVVGQASMQSSSKKDYNRVLYLTKTSFASYADKKLWNFIANGMKDNASGCSAQQLNTFLSSKGVLNKRVTTRTLRPSKAQGVSHRSRN